MAARASPVWKEDEGGEEQRTDRGGDARGRGGR